ncbi:hypothetical protein N9X12_07955 [Alphaproteobacteria bacterium]|nr:hypothetical protein [Alphaproteobacteria bacterium]
MTPTDPVTSDNQADADTSNPTLTSLQTDQTTDLTTISDLNDVAVGTVLFDDASINKPDSVTGAGVMHTVFQGDIGWQMLIANDAPREFWQRTRKPAAPYWRNWRKFVDLRTVNDVITEAQAAASQADAAKLKSLIAEHGADEVIARDAAIASAVSSAVSDMPPSLDRPAVETIVESRLDNELDDERTARNDAINAAINAATSIITAGRKGAIDSAIAAERAAIDRSVDSKTGILDAKVTTLDGKLETERNDRMAAVADEMRKRNAAITAERDARTTALENQRAELKNVITNIRPEFDAHITTAIQTERSQRSVAIAAEADKLTLAIAAEAETRDYAIGALDTKVTGDIAEARRAITSDIATAVTTERDARKAADRAVTMQIANSAFPSGTKMLFRQSNAPTGWTKDTAHNDKALRIVSGAVGAGGNVGFSRSFTNRSVSGGVFSRVSGTVGAHRLTRNEMPSHQHYVVNSHNVTNRSNSDPSPSNYITRGASHNPPGDEKYLLRANGAVASAGLTSSSGKNHSHGHAWRGYVSSTFRGDSLDMRVRYVDVIIATKD